MSVSRVADPIFPRARFKSWLKKQSYQPRPGSNRIALVLAAHNEEYFLYYMLESAVMAGLSPHNIYVIDDGSWDHTRDEALRILPPENVVSVWQKGKAGAIAALVARKKLTQRYDWIHLTDADGFFGPGYFTNLQQKLNPKYAAATTYMKSMSGTPTSEYRVYEYTWAMEVLRPVQSFMQLITIIPGPAAVYRSDVFEKLDFSRGTLTEDFDATMQMRRMKLGDVVYVKDSCVYTQDPKNLKDFKKQIQRWYRGLFQVARIHGLGFGFQREDFYFLYQFIQVLIICGLYFVSAPIMWATQGSPKFLATLFIYDILIFLGVVFLMGLWARKPKIILSGARYYLMRWISVFTFVKAFGDVMILGRFKPGNNKWSTHERRYQTRAVGESHV